MTEPTPLRTEGAKATRQPFSVILGGTGYELVPLSIRSSKVWKAKLSESLGGIMASFNGDLTDQEQAVEAIRSLLTSSDDVVLDLLADYGEVDRETKQVSAQLDRDRVEDEASAGEAFEALTAMARIEFPFLQTLRDVTTLAG